MTLQRRKILKAGGLGALALTFGRSIPAFGADPYRIGALNPVTGAGSPYGSGIQKSILFSADEVNAAGGPAGRKLEVFAEDSQTSPEAGVLAAKKLVEVNKVNAIVGTWSSGVALAVAPIFDGAGLLHMTNAGTSALAEQNKKGMIFRFSAISERIGRVLADGVLAEGMTRVATMAFNNASGREVTQGAKQQLEQKGHKLTGEVVYEPNRPSYRSELQQILAGNPQVILMGAFLPDMTVIVREAVQSGANVKFIAPAWAANANLVQALGPDATDGIMTADYVSALAGDTYKRFSARYKQVTGNDVGENYYAACAYDMVQVLALAIEAAGPTADNQAIAAAMRQVANPGGKPVYNFADGRKGLAAKEKINYEGASGPIDFDARGDVKALFKLSVLKKGKIEFLRVVPS